MKRTTPMKRSAFKPKYPVEVPHGPLRSMLLQLAKPPKEKKPLKSSTKRMKSGRSTTKPTNEESAWMGWITDFGCVVCALQHKVKTPCAVHHIVEGGRRLGHLFTIGLCDPGHHQNTPDKALKISRHPTKQRFEAEYGTEYELLAYLQNKQKALPT